MKRGRIHIYTGPGKGKTTAAIGLAVRAAGAGFNVLIYQFLKGRRSSEFKTLKKVNNIRLIQCGRQSFVGARPCRVDIECARSGLARAQKDIFCGKYDLVILDEINVAVKTGLIKAADIVSVLASKPAAVELVLTGRGAGKALIAHADYVTRFVKVRHPFDKGIKARIGIEE